MIKGNADKDGNDGKQQHMNVDIVINGGGMVGAALACGLTQAGFSVAVIEHSLPEAFSPSALPDIRVSALGRHTVNYLSTLGIWQDILQCRCAPYRELETWEWQTARVNFSAEQLGLAELGFMVENSVLQHVLWQQLREKKIVQFAPDKIKRMHHQKEEEYWLITLESGQLLHSRLLIGADGAHSIVRTQAGIASHGWDYSQHCLILSVRCESVAGDVTWQQFSPQGPRAFLPLYDNYASLVWYDKAERIQQLKKLSRERLAEVVQAEFPARLGKVEILEVGAFPLRRHHAKTYFSQGVVLVGDAAHTINPLAGQGVNLGYRDIDCLVTLLAEAKKRAWWRQSVLMRYQEQRYFDNQIMQSGIDAFYFTFSNHHAPLKLLRNLALMAAERSGILKQKMLKYALGL